MRHVFIVPQHIKNRIAKQIVTLLMEKGYA